MYRYFPGLEFMAQVNHTTGAPDGAPATDEMINGVCHSLFLPAPSCSSTPFLPVHPLQGNEISSSFPTLPSGTRRNLRKLEGTSMCILVDHR